MIFLITKGCQIFTNFAIHLPEFMPTSIYLDVILPLALPQTYTYSASGELAGKLQVGIRVIVPFGARKFYSAIICKIHHQSPTAYAVKEIVAVLDEKPVVGELQLRFWQWIASYYMCTIGEVMKAAIPSGLKLESETKVFFNPAYIQVEELNEWEEQILNIVHDKQSLAVREIAALYRRKDLMRVVQSLVDKEALWVEEVVEARYKPKYEYYIQIHPSVDSESQMKLIFDSLGRAPKQLSLLMSYISHSGCFSGGTIREIGRKELLDTIGASADALNSLLKKNILSIYTKEISRLPKDDISFRAATTFTPHQENAMQAITDHFLQKDIVLLHGVTSSGKTEVYIRLIEEQLAQGKQVLYLLPEIALTTQITDRLKAVFKDRVGVYHSRFPDSERVEIWNRVLNFEYDVILGVRSSIFLPFSNLGLVIVDEEHENTFKQFDPAPRYHARDAAMVLASMYGAKVLLGSATPSLESYHHAKTGKYGLVELNQRYADMSMPSIEIVDTSWARKQKTMQSHFHPTLLALMNETLQSNKQIILFQNRRGFAPYLQCRLCEYVPHCKNCDVSLTYHKHSDRLVCHYCGYSSEVIHQCPECKGMEMVTVGFGTEKIEDEMQLFFPEARIARLDLDSSRSRSGFERIIHRFAQQDIDILVGTQMITKGLDFDHVGLVGVLNADNMLNFPDFRAFERSFQLMTQVSGRAGRKGEQGKVIIQSSNPRHPVLGFIVRNDYTGMYASQLEERLAYKYPPFYRLIKLTLKHRNKDTVHTAAHTLGSLLSTTFGSRVLGPEIPLISRIQNNYIENVLLKIERKASMQQAKQLISEAIDRVRPNPDYKGLSVVSDVDPV